MQAGGLLGENQLCNVELISGNGNNITHTVGADRTTRAGGTGNASSKQCLNMGCRSWSYKY